ncbi:transporter [Sphingobium sp. DC-2]|uniref:transporter n=1 Tax=Sphingobium sp. DC-2 TaxID=1303256 RepID=UPI00069194E3|nr:transporter [Sphingobium sp. DC-2]
MDGDRMVIARLAAGCLMLSAGVSPPLALARGASPIEAQLQAMRRDLDAQRATIEAQNARISLQDREIARLRADMAAAGPVEEKGTSAKATTHAEASAPTQPVGEAPSLIFTEPKVEALPEEAGVLTRAGRLTFDPSIEYSTSSSNRLVFRGIELTPGIQIGLIEANEAVRNSIVPTATLRYGLTNRIELEARLPYLFRSDRVEVVQQRESSISRVLHLSEQHIGDAELALRYQLNQASGDHPIWIGSLRVKMPTGKGPFDIAYDEYGVAQGLATGSGFWAMQPGLSFLLPSDPAVIFGGVSYLRNFSADIGREIGGVAVGRVDPGDAINANLGFGFALNPRFSFSLGYEHNYIFPTKTMIDGVVQRSRSIQIGAFSFGMSYRLTERQMLNVAVEVGTTDSAPDANVTVRMPFSVR